MVIKGDLTDFVKEHKLNRKWLAYTQTFKDDRRLYKLRPINQLRRITPLFAVLSAIGPWAVQVELTNNNIIHLHGIIAVDNPCYLAEYGHRHLDAYGHKLFKTIDDMDKWIAYCEKERKDINDVFKNRIEFPLTYKNYCEIYNVSRKATKLALIDWADSQAKTASLAEAKGNGETVPTRETIGE